MALSPANHGNHAARVAAASAITSANPAATFNAVLPCSRQR